MQNVDITASSHNTDPDEKWTHDPKAFEDHIVGIIKHKAPVYELESRQYPYSLDLYKSKAASGEENADLVTCIQDDEIFFDPNCLALIWMPITHFLTHYVSKTRDNCVFEEIDRHEVEN